MQRRPARDEQGEGRATVYELVADGYAGYDPSGPRGGFQDREGLRAHCERLRAGFQDARIEIEDVIADGDRTAVRFTVTGTHTGFLNGIPPTGRTARVSGMLLSRFAGARIVEEWAVYDMLGLLQQIGMIPGPQSATA